MALVLFGIEFSPSSPTTTAKTIQAVAHAPSGSQWAAALEAASAEVVVDSAEEALVASEVAASEAAAPAEAGERRTEPRRAHRPNGR